MARKFSLPEVAKLEVGQSCFVEGKAGEIRRKVRGYEARNKHHFQMLSGPAGVHVYRHADPEPQP